MNRKSGFVLVALLLAVSLGCSNHRDVMLPPRIDLTQHELIGVVEFDSSEEGELGPLVTRRFTESARRDQGVVRMVGFGSRADVVASVGQDEWDAETVKALGEKHGVRTIVIGELTISDVKPDIRVSSSLRSGSLSAQVNATLAVQLIETSTGASLWSTSARAKRDVGHVSVFQGKEIAFDATDPERVYGGLIDSLVAQVTRDFQVSWERQ